MKQLILVLVLSASLTCRAAADEFMVRISLDQATRQVLGSGNHRVLGAQTLMINGREVHVIKVLTHDGRIRYFRIDAETGALLS
ncbi:PepSY domain-containing protein [Methylomicrobium sp. Wu6]|uniref:PepSY domain-containing protein n=1 Tax=Methylomicrobium sp. Wu6 TaxID=3107928 RepID=UPI002DD67241|nr:PepSY domain-containing protein [Methylomicrobium sp. Wu6]MEC4749464.1 PepSY domain-containing protein [Methylomicrobium sp. Wu6]